MEGKPLCELEFALGAKPGRFKTCDDARKFVLRIVPSLAYVFSLLLMLAKRTATECDDKDISISASLSQLGQCVKRGFDTHEKCALNRHLRNEYLSRVELHERFEQNRPYLDPDPGGETWERTLERVRAAMPVA